MTASMTYASWSANSTRSGDDSDRSRESARTNPRPRSSYRSSPVTTHAFARVLASAARTRRGGSSPVPPTAVSNIRSSARRATPSDTVSRSRADTARSSVTASACITLPVTAWLRTASSSAWRNPLIS